MMKLSRFGRSVLMLLFALALAFLSLGCGGTSAETKKEPSDEDKPLIGMSFDSFLIERWQRDRDVFVSTASELGAEVNVQIANGDPAEQISQIEYFITKKVDAIVVVAVDCYGLSEIVQKARDTGIYVISYDRLIMNANSDLYISFDNEMVGTMMAEALVANLPYGGSVLSICGSPTDQNVSQAWSRRNTRPTGSRRPPIVWSTKPSPRGLFSTACAAETMTSQARLFLRSPNTGLPARSSS